MFFSMIHNNLVEDKPKKVTITIELFNLIKKKHKNGFSAKNIEIELYLSRDCVNKTIRKIENTDKDNVELMDISSKKRSPCKKFEHVIKRIISISGEGYRYYIRREQKQRIGELLQ